MRTRLMAAFAVPILAVAVVTGTQFRGAQVQADDARQQAEFAQSTGGPIALVTALTDERDIAALEMADLAEGMELPAADSEAARAHTDSELAAFQHNLDATTSGVRAIYEPVLQRIGTELASLRRFKDANHHPVGLDNLEAYTVFGLYSDVIDDISPANALAVQHIDDASMRNVATALADATTASDAMSRFVGDVLFRAFTQGGDLQRPALRTLNGMYADYLAAKQSALSLVAAERRPAHVLTAHYRRATQQDFERQAGQILDGVQFDPYGLLDAAGSQSVPNLHNVWDSLSTAVDERANELIASAERDRRNAALLFFSTVIALVACAVVASRSLTRPLARIAGEANALAERTLPATIATIEATPAGEELVVPEHPPVSASSITEVDAVARALNSIQDRSLSLAMEQAALRRRFTASFAGLGHRVERLAGAQLALLDEIEDAETDAAQLDRLFRLDHIATRVQRNAENLAMLARADDEVIRFAAEPWRVADLIRAAARATDDVDRVVAGTVDDEWIVGWAGSEVANLLSELMDNAIAFTPDEVPVKVTGTRLKDGTYTIEVIDNGNGMSSHGLAAANRRLSGEESFTEAPSNYLGHFVIGHIARRIGAEVRLDHTIGGGVTATVRLPAELVYVEVRQTGHRDRLLEHEQRLTETRPDVGDEPVENDDDRDGDVDRDEATVPGSDPRELELVGATNGHHSVSHRANIASLRRRINQR